MAKQVLMIQKIKNEAKGQRNLAMSSFLALPQGTAHAVFSFYRTFAAIAVSDISSMFWKLKKEGRSSSGV